MMVAWAFSSAGCPRCDGPLRERGPNQKWRRFFECGQCWATFEPRKTVPALRPQAREVHAAHDHVAARPHGMDALEVEMRIAIYARVSTANNGQDPAMQTRELREYARRRGWTVAGEYVDVGISGTKETRPELDRLMSDAHRSRGLEV
jgi:resolvase-like protein